MVLAHQTIPGINLWRVLCVGSWNALSLSEDHQLLHFSHEVSRLRVDMVRLSETRRPHSGKTRSKSFTYYWSSMSNDKGVAKGIPRRLQLSIVEVMPLRVRYSYGIPSNVK